jgi:DnaK suppressor protein
VAQERALRTAIAHTQQARSLTFTDDEHDPEGSTASLDQARDTALLAQVRRTLTELEAARDRLAAGTYGTCERCGRPVAAERLAARPEARTCVACASRTLRP